MNVPAITALVTIGVAVVIIVVLSLRLWWVGKRLKEMARAAAIAEAELTAAYRESVRMQAELDAVRKVAQAIDELNRKAADAKSADPAAGITASTR